MTMKPLGRFPKADKARIRFVLTDIDDTLTTAGRLPAVAYRAMEKLRAAGLKVVPITGRPAGWCDHIARMWPVDGVVGENGAFYFHYDDEARKMVRRYWKTDAERDWDRNRLDKLEARIISQVPGAAVASDQPYREADLAIDFREDVPPLPDEDIQKIVTLFQEAGAIAKISSIHVNGWFGDYDKLTMTRRFFSEVLGESMDEVLAEVVFCGDSPNDAPMFAAFPNAVGVANVRQFEAQLEAKPMWLTPREGGEGFAQLADALLRAKIQAE